MRSAAGEGTGPGVDEKDKVQLLGFKVVPAGSLNRKTGTKRQQVPQTTNFVPPIPQIIGVSFAIETLTW
jgi:hypothetical protein